MIAAWLILAKLVATAAGVRYNCDFTPADRCCWYFAGETNPLMMNSIRSSSSAQIVRHTAVDVPAWLKLIQQRFPPRAPYLQLSTGNASAIATAVWASCPMCSETVNIQLAFRHWLSPTAQLSVCIRHNIDGTSMNLTDPNGVDCIPVARSVSNHSIDYVSTFSIVVRPRKLFVLFLLLRSKSSIWHSPAAVLIDHIHVSMQECAGRISVGGAPRTSVVLRSTSPRPSTITATRVDGRKFDQPPPQMAFIGNWKSGMEFVPVKKFIGSKTRLNATSALIAYQKIEREFDDMTGVKQHKAEAGTMKLIKPTHFINSVLTNKEDEHKNDTKFNTKVPFNYGRNGDVGKRYDDVSNHSSTINTNISKMAVNFAVKDNTEKQPDKFDNAALFNIDLHVTRKDSRLEKYAIKNEKDNVVKRTKSYGTSRSAAHHVFPARDPVQPNFGRDGGVLNIPKDEKHIHRKQFGLLTDPSRRLKYDQINAQKSIPALFGVLKNVVFREQRPRAKIYKINFKNVSSTTTVPPAQINVADTLDLLTVTPDKTAISPIKGAAEIFGDDFAAFLEPSFQTEP